MRFDTLADSEIHGRGARGGRAAAREAVHNEPPFRRARDSVNMETVVTGVCREKHQQSWVQ